MTIKLQTTFSIKNGNDFEVKVYTNLIIDWDEKTIAPKIEKIRNRELKHNYSM